MQVNHIDEDISNCALSNLNLMTAKDNSNYGTRGERLSASISAVRKKKYWSNRNLLDQ
jgi:hypothetical protein